MLPVQRRGWGQIRFWVQAGEAIGGLSGLRGGSRAPRICLDLWHWAVSDASARARLGPH